MPSYILKLEDDGKEYFLEWSTIVDAPVSYAMQYDEFRDFYQQEYGRSKMAEFEERIARARAKGTSSMLHESADDIIDWNRAGPNETNLSKEEIIEKYIRQRGNKIRA